MSAPVVVSFLWPKNVGVLVELARRGHFDIASPPAVVPETITAMLEAVGQQYIPVVASEFPSYAAAKEDEARLRFEQISPSLAELVATPVAAPGQIAATTAVMQDLIPISLRNAMAVIDELDALLEKRKVVAVLVNETDVVSGRLLALWAKERGIPSFLLSHGSNIGQAYSVTACMLADFLFVFGARGKETYLDIGISSDRMLETGNPAWDRYPDVLAARAQYRTDVYSRFDLRPAEPLVLFATVSHTKLTTLLEPDVFERTLRAFMQACLRLRSSGVKFNVVIKDRPSNAEFGKKELHRIAAEEGFSDFGYGIGDMEAYMVSADLVISSNSNTFVEAMAAGVPAINLWLPSTWFLGPGFDASDGIPLIECDDTAGLAARMQAVLEDAGYRSTLVAQMTQRLPYYHMAMDGGATRRVVDAVLTVIDARAAAAGPSVREKKLLDLIEREPRSVLVLGRNGIRIVEELQRRYPACAVHAVEDLESEAPLSEAVADGRVDLAILANAIEETYDGARLLGELKNCLAGDAQVVAAVPNVRNLWLAGELASGRWRYQPDGLLDPRRLRFFTLQSVNALFAGSGYQIQTVNAERDPRISALPSEAEGLVNIETEKLTLKNLNQQDLLEFATLDFLLSARPVA